MDEVKDEPAAWRQRWRINVHRPRQYTASEIGNTVANSPRVSGLNSSVNQAVETSQRPLVVNLHVFAASDLDNTVRAPGPKVSSISWPTVQKSRRSISVDRLLTLLVCLCYFSTEPAAKAAVWVNVNMWTRTYGRANIVWSQPIQFLDIELRTESDL